MWHDVIKEVNAAAITRFHDAALSTAAKRHSGVGIFEPVWQWIQQDHRCNALLWNEEGKARRGNVQDAYIAACKRRIDRYNQQRTDAVEAIDECLLGVLRCFWRIDGGGARLHSETAGAMIDRLSVLSLEIRHMRKQAERTGVPSDHVARCRAKLAALVEQRGDLARCLDELLAGAVLGRVYFKIYRQPRMHDDPSLSRCISGTYGNGGSVTA